MKTSTGIHRFCVLLLLICLSAPNSSRVLAQGFDQFLARVNLSPDSLKMAIVDSFMNAVGTMPVIERDSVVCFVYRGNATSVNVPGDMNGWDMTAYPMYSISRTDFWFTSHVFEPDARLDYKFVTNGGNWILDPLNPHLITGGFGPNSELSMPDYVPSPEIQFDQGIAHGTVTDTVIASATLANSRHVRVYTPPGYETLTDTMGMVLFHDGLDYLNLGSAANVLDYLIAHHEIQPVIGVFVPPVNRDPEYIGSQIDQFTSFIVDQIIPWVDARYRTRHDPASRVTLGASNGGYISLWIAYHHPDVFACVAPQSSTTMSIASMFQASPKLPLTFSIDVGTYDLYGFLQGSQYLVSVLQAKGYDYQYTEYHEGHSWGNWRAHFGKALKEFFPGNAAAVHEDIARPSSFGLDQNFPNPFNPTTVVSYQVPVASNVRLVVYDLLGRDVEVLVNERKAPGSYDVQFNASGLASGVYLCRLQAGPWIQTRKMILIR